jgi:hypothetical protein
MNGVVPNVYIQHNSIIDRDVQKQLSTLFISFCNNNFENKLIKLNNFAQIHEYDYLKQNKFLYKSIEVFFSNKGKSLYILNFPLKDEQTFNIIDFENFINRNCDNLIDLETIVAIDLYSTQIYKEILSLRSIISIQRSINIYCKNTNRISITDISDDFEEKYYDMLGETIIYYPWIKDKNSYTLPPSVYATSLLSRLANDNKLATSIANKEISNAQDVQKTLTDKEKSEFINHNINPVVFVPFKGVRIWGTKVFDSNIDTINELRILKYIKRNLQYIAKPYIFEQNDKNLENKIVIKTKDLLYELWDHGFLAGSSAQEAFSISSQTPDLTSSENILTIKIGVALVKPLEYIMIELNKIEKDNAQSTIKVS